MKDFSDYLHKFKALLQGKVVQTGLIMKVVESVSGVRLEEKQIKIKANTLFLSVSPLMKNHIYLSKEKILRALAEAGVTNITEIR